MGTCTTCGKEFVGRDVGTVVGSSRVCLYCLAELRRARKPPRLPTAGPSPSAEALAARASPAAPSALGASREPQERCAACFRPIVPGEPAYAGVDEVLCGLCYRKRKRLRAVRRALMASVAFGVVVSGFGLWLATRPRQQRTEILHSVAGAVGVRTDRLPHVSQAIEEESFSTSAWYLTGSGETGYPKLSPGEVMQNWAGWTGELGGDEARLLDGNKAIVNEVVATIGGEGRPYMKGPPVRLLEGKDGRCLLVTKLYDDTEYNTLKLSERQRALDAIRNNVSNRLFLLCDDAEKMECKDVGIMVFFGARDFSEEYAFGSGECAAMVAPIPLVRGFEAKSVSEDELFEKSSVYISGSGAGAKLVRLSPD